MATAQDKLLIQAAIADMLAVSDITDEIGVNIVQSEQGVAVTYPQIAVGVDFESSDVGLPSRKGTLSITTSFIDSVPANKTTLRNVNAEVMELFDVDYVTSAIIAYVSGLKLRFCALRNAPYLYDQIDNLFYCPSEYDVTLGS